MQLECEENALLPWLLNQSSMMDKLKAESGEARLVLIDQSWQKASAWEEEALKLKEATLLKREILVSSGKNLCWYGRTLIPETTFKADEALFERLKTEPLGAIIYHNERIERVSKQHYSINAKAREYQWLKPAWHEGREHLCLRFSEFHIDKARVFFLFEILLPGLLRASSNKIGLGHE